MFSFSSIILCKIIWIILQTILYFFKYILVFELKHAFLTAVIYTNSYIYQNKNWLLIFWEINMRKKTNGSTFQKKRWRNKTPKSIKTGWKTWKIGIMNAAFYAGQSSTRTHHVFSFKNCVSLRLDLDNGITLCHWCHKKYHAFYNLENTSPHTLLKFFKDFRF